MKLRLNKRTIGAMPERVASVVRQSKEARASGEWAGVTEMRCNATVPLPHDCVMVEEMIFCGYPMLTIYSGLDLLMNGQLLLNQPTQKRGG